MNRTKLLAEKRVATEPASKSELGEFRVMVALNLKDAQVAQISGQGRYEFTYNAARLMATVAVRASGYRVIAKSGHHYFTFQALQAVDPAFGAVALLRSGARQAE